LDLLAAQNQSAAASLRFLRRRLVRSDVLLRLQLGLQVLGRELLLRLKAWLLGGLAGEALHGRTHAATAI